MPTRRTIASTAAAALAFLCLLNRAAADPGYYVVTPYDNAGVATLDLRYWTTKARGRPETVWPEFGIGYGINSRWTTELFWSGIGPSPRRVRGSSLNWQNQLLLTQGEWPLDVAVHLQLVHDLSGDGEHWIEFGPVLQTDFGRTQVNLNLVFERPWRRRAGDDDPTRAKYQWQLRHRWLPQLHLGAMGFGELGPWERALHADRASHRAGPAAFMTLRTQGGPTYRLQAGWLVGKTYGQRGHMFTLRSHVDF